MFIWLRISAIYNLEALEWVQGGNKEPRAKGGRYEGSDSCTDPSSEQQRGLAAPSITAGMCILETCG